MRVEGVYMLDVCVCVCVCDILDYSVGVRETGTRRRDFRRGLVTLVGGSSEFQGRHDGSPLSTGSPTPCVGRVRGTDHL